MKRWKGSEYTDETGTNHNLYTTPGGEGVRFEIDQPSCLYALQTQWAVVAEGAPETIGRYAPSSSAASKRGSPPRAAGAQPPPATTETATRTTSPTRCPGATRPLGTGWSFASSGTSTASSEIEGVEAWFPGGGDRVAYAGITVNGKFTRYESGGVNEGLVAR
jgi:hypothetical protein